MQDLSKVIFVLLIGICFSLSILPYSFGHGQHHEYSQPVLIGDKKVVLQFSSIASFNPDSNSYQIYLSLFDADTGLTTSDTTYLIKAKKNNEMIFEHTFKKDSGSLLIDFIPTDSGKTVVEIPNKGIFDSLIGSEKNEPIKVKGTSFNSGGLYNFQIEILTMDSYSYRPEQPVQFNVVIPFPDQKYHKIYDPNFGNQQFRLISYFDQTDNFQYEPQSRSISFSMPFDWSEANINKTSVVHEELAIPKLFGSLMVKDYSTYLNGLELPKTLTIVDDFWLDHRLVHVILNHNDLLDLSKKFEVKKDKMEFLIKPSQENVAFNTITENGQHEIIFEQPIFKSDSSVELTFNIYEVFPKTKVVAAGYDLSVIYDEKIIYDKTGISSDSVDVPTKVTFDVPSSIEMPIVLFFSNVGGNENSVAQFSIANTGKNSGNPFQASEISVPEWVRNNALWWSDGLIEDKDFLSGIEYLINQGVIKMPASKSSSEDTLPFLPNWIKDTAGWWGAGRVTDQDFVNAIQYLIEHGIIRV